MSLNKTVSQDLNEEPTKSKMMTVVSVIWETEGVKLIKRTKAQRESVKPKNDDSWINTKGSRKDSMKTMIKDTGASFSFNMNILYPKNVYTYSAYVKNMEGFIKSTINMKKDLSPKKSRKEKRLKLIASESMVSSTKNITTAGQSKSNNTIKNAKAGPDNPYDETHPTLKKRYARLFITVNKKTGYGYKLKYIENEPEYSIYGHSSLFHAKSDLGTNTKMTNDNSENTAATQSRQEMHKIISELDLKKYEEEWLPKSKYIEKDIHFRIFNKYAQVPEVNLTNIYDPPLTMKEIKRMRREKRKLYKIKGLKGKNGKPVMMKAKSAPIKKEE